MSNGSIYSASDKALFDAINQTAVTSSDLRSLFLKHGMIISKSTPRRELAKHFARLLHDYHDFEALSRMFDSRQRRERSSSRRVASNATIDNFEAAALEVVEKLRGQQDSATVNIQSDGTVQVNVRYKKFHWNKSEFRQIEIKEAVITIAHEDGAIVLRGPENEKVDAIMNDIVSTLESQIEGPLEVEQIGLEEFESENRNKFFKLLIDSVPGYSQIDVTDVYFYNPDKGAVLDELGDDAEFQESDDDESVLGIHITSASLKGGRVLESPEMQDLLAKGFYIWKIVWKVRESSFDSAITELEAQFSEQETCTSFSYLVKGYYEYQGKGVYSKHRKHYGSQDDRKIGKLIEISARSAIGLLRNSLGGNHAKTKVG